MRYKKLPNQKGIYEDSKTGKLHCQKRVNKKLYTTDVDSLKEAKYWIKNFSPNNVLFTKIKIDDFDELNGRVSAIFSEVWDKYQKEHVRFLEITTQEHYEKCLPFFASIMNNDVRQLTPNIISRLTTQKKIEYVDSKRNKRLNFNHELKCLSAVLNWWRDHYDYKYVCPVIRRIHFPLGVIKKGASKSKAKMPVELVSKFISGMYQIGTQNDLYAMLAEIQFLTMTRIQEVSCIQIDQIDFESKILTFDRALAFTRLKKNKNYVKGTKTDDVKTLKITPKMEQIFLTLINRKPNKCDFLFQIDGDALTYRKIQHNYNKGLKLIGAYPNFSSTHIMRHAAAHSVREFLSLDHTQAMGGWKTSKLAEHYSGLSNNLVSEGVFELENRLKIVK